MESSSAGVSPRRLHDAIDGAVAFLLSARSSAGWWQDFHLAPGFSDEWVTAYTGAALALPTNQAAREAAWSAWEQLQTRRRPTNGWAYNVLPPPDADSTAWALILAQRLAVDDDVSQNGALFLQEHLRPDGGITTYADEAAIRRFIRAPADRSFLGWCGSHVCVSAAAAHLTWLRPRLMDYLRRSTQPGGHWQSYWWCDDAYATALAAASLDPYNIEDRKRIRRAAEWAAGKMTRDPSGAFETAWLAATLRLDPRHEPARIAAISGLLTQQRPDGSWESSALLRVPLPEDTDPHSFTGWVHGGTIEGSVVVDQRAVFTTATVLSALATA